MNAKQAKRLRREANYHPSQPRKYKWTKHMKSVPAKDGGMARLEVYQLELDEADQRAFYNELKKEFYQGGAM